MKEATQLIKSMPAEMEVERESLRGKSVKLTEGMVLAKARSSDLENVKKLNCWGIGLTDVSIFAQMPKIEVIGVSVNNITHLEHFSHCPNLTELYIRKNCIADLGQVWYLKKLPKLKVLWLADNPCAAGEKYRYSVLKMLPNLQKLDNITVTNDEVNRAMEDGEELPLPSPSYTNGHIPSSEDKENRDSSIEFMTLEETNTIREQLGLKPLPVEKLQNQMSPAKLRGPHSSMTSHRNSNVLSAVLTLLKELDEASLEVVANACKDKLASL